jgi:hypothetical protein
VVDGRRERGAARGTRLGSSSEAAGRRCPRGSKGGSEGERVRIEPATIAGSLKRPRIQDFDSQPEGIRKQAPVQSRSRHVWRPDAPTTSAPPGRERSHDCGYQGAMARKQETRTWGSSRASRRPDLVTAVLRGRLETASMAAIKPLPATDRLPDDGATYGAGPAGEGRRSAKGSAASPAARGAQHRRRGRRRATAGHRGQGRVGIVSASELRPIRSVTRPEEGAYTDGTQCVLPEQGGSPYSSGRPDCLPFPRRSMLTRTTRRRSSSCRPIRSSARR